jgi:hypothetical protein
MSANLIQTAKEVAKDVMAGNNILSDDVEINRRKEICKACEHIMSQGFLCSKCGCFMEAKTRILAAKCPIAKW